MRKTGRQSRQVQPSKGLQREGEAEISAAYHWEFQPKLAIVARRRHGAERRAILHQRTHAKAGHTTSRRQQAKSGEAM